MRKDGRTVHSGKSGCSSPQTYRLPENRGTLYGNNQLCNKSVHTLYLHGLALTQADIRCAWTNACMINPRIGTGGHGFSFNSNYFWNDPRYALSSLSFFFFLKITSFRAPIMSQKKGDSARENKKVSKGWIMLNVKYKGQRLRDNI